MALVSSVTPTTSLYPSVPALHSRAESHPPPLVRALPSPLPAPVSKPIAPPSHMSSSPSKSGGGPTVAHYGAAGSAGLGSRTGGTPAPASVKAGSPSSPVQARQALPGSSAGSGPASFGAGSSPASNANGLGSNGGIARVPSPLPPVRSASTPPTTVHGSPHRPNATPLPGQGGSFRHQHSASSSSNSNSSSSLPRISTGGQQPPHLAYMAQPQLAHPSFVGQPFSPFAPPHAFAHPAFPFVPSPHPNQSSNYVNFGPNGQITPGGSAEQQKRIQQFQQAQWAAAASQMEMLRNQQAQTTWQNNDGRRRTTSGPAPNHSPTYYTSPLPFPPSPSPSLQQNAQLAGPKATPSFPAGAMPPHFANHGYPTPPGSVEGGQRGAESGGSSSSGSRDGGYHPYRRDHGQKSSSSESGRVTSSSGPSRSHASTPSTSSLSSRAGTPKISGGQPFHQSQAQQQLQQPRPSVHGRSDSQYSYHSTASQAYPSQGVPRSHTASPSISSVRSASLPSSTSSPQLPSPAYARSRTQSANSSSSSLPRPSTDSSTLTVPAGRGASFDSTRSATPVQGQIRGRPSPLGGQHRPLPVESDDEASDDEGAESDGTAEATATVSAASGYVSRSPTMNSVATVRATSGGLSSGPTDKGKEKEREKEKEKKGMKSRFKKAFGGGSSSTTLAEAELDGRGPKAIHAGFRPRHDSASSNGSTNPRSPTTTGSMGHASQPSIASFASSDTRTMNGDGDSTRKAPSGRFRLLNSKLNGSSDNLSISSTVSSASVMIRKLGQMGKLARRNSLMGLTKAFKKDKKDDQDDGDARDGGKKDKKKSGASVASVSHATAEADSLSHSPGMSPAAALAKRQQAHYAEQEAAEAKAAEEAARLAHARSESMASDVASVKSGRSGKWGIGKSKTTDDAMESRARALEKEKEKLKSRGGNKGSRFRLGFGGSKTDLNADTDSVTGGDTDSLAPTERGGSALGLYRDEGDRTPRQSLEILAPPPGYPTYGGERERRDSSSDYEPSLYRHGAAPPANKPKAVKGILKGAGTYSQDDYARPRPGFHRNRASSFDAPQQQNRPGSPGGAALVNVIPSQAQVDGVAQSSTSPRFDTHLPSSTEQIHDAAFARTGDGATGGAVYNNPSMNASAPVLAHFTAQPSLRSSSAPGGSGRRIVFAANLSVHTTWPAAIYDRRAEPATCNRLTPTLAQQIKEELNSFKMEEMDVHPDSRKLTHFFV
ncbi:hypothetical protein JCM10212_006720 [Sporobolomyces blumeae]